MTNLPGVDYERVAEYDRRQAERLRRDAVANYWESVDRRTGNDRRAA